MLGYARVSPRVDSRFYPKQEDDILRIPRASLMAACILAVLLYTPVLADAQQKLGVAPGGYPNKPIRVVVTIAAGSGPDTIVRIVGRIVTEKMGQPMVVDNRPGGGTVLATDLVAHPAPDGYTLLASTDTLLLVGAMKRVSYDVRKAFEPVVQMTAQWYVLVVNPSLPIKSVAELIVYAKARPDALSYASQGVGTTGHLSMERFKSMAGVSMVHVPYKGAAPALLDIIGGQVQTMFSGHRFRHSARRERETARCRRQQSEAPAVPARTADRGRIRGTGLPRVEFLQSDCAGRHAARDPLCVEQCDQHGAQRARDGEASRRRRHRTRAARDTG